MPIKSSNWIDSFRVTWAHGHDNSWLTDHEWRLKILAGGLLHFGTKQAGGGAFSTYPAHSWIRVDMPSLSGRLANQSTSGWDGGFAVWWADEQAPPLDLYGDYQVKILDGGLLLLEAKEEEPEGVIVVAPHTWNRLKGAFDFSE